MKNDKQKKIINGIFIVVTIIAFTFYCFELVVLHFNQTQYPVTGMYESDLYAHIEMALSGWGYSIMAVVFRLLSNLPAFGFYFSIAALLCTLEAFTIALTYVFMRNFLDDAKVAMFLAFVSGFVMPFYLRSVQPYRYIGYQSGSIWHNSTYIVMKFFALLCVVLYLAISNAYKEKMKAWEVVTFAILLAVTTSVKTNFILVFAPVALVFLIIDLILGVPVKRIIFCALTVIPSMAVILFQRYVLFGEETGNGIIIDPLYSVYLRAEQPYFTMILSAAFPVFVLLYNLIFVLSDTIKDFREKRGNLTHRFFLLAWSMWFVGFLELILLRETGQRELDDNFAWGYDFCLFLVFTVSIIYFANNIKSLVKRIKDSKENTGNALAITFTTAYAAAAALMLVYHTYCGIFFFARLTQGVTFFMQ